MPAKTPPAREIRAVFDDKSIRVYQAYADEIADAALKHGRFVSPPFSMTRMTWIKPSFLWMMYRAGWGNKDAGQKRILAIDISRAGFEHALAQSCISHHDPSSGESHAHWAQRLQESAVRLQWDPERDLSLAPQPWRSLQLGLRGAAVQAYVHDWISAIEDITPRVHEIHARVEARAFAEAQRLLPQERAYPLNADIAKHIGADHG